jgi:hypothetical protein
MSIIDATWIFSFGVRFENIEVLKQALLVSIILEGAS